MKVSSEKRDGEILIIRSSIVHFRGSKSSHSSVCVDVSTRFLSLSEALSAAGGVVVHLASVSIKNVSADSSVSISADSFGRGEVVSADRLT